MPPVATLAVAQKLNIYSWGQLRGRLTNQDLVQYGREWNGGCKVELPTTTIIPSKHGKPTIDSTPLIIEPPKYFPATTEILYEPGELVMPQWIQPSIITTNERVTVRG